MIRHIRLRHAHPVSLIVRACFVVVGWSEVVSRGIIIRRFVAAIETRSQTYVQGWVRQHVQGWSRCSSGVLLVVVAIDPRCTTVRRSVGIVSGQVIIFTIGPRSYAAFKYPFGSRIKRYNVLLALAAVEVSTTSR